jgi:AcrR family transcriptional regulator
MHDIMQLAAVPGGSLYHCFPTKKSLGLAVIEERVAADVTQTWIEPIRHAPSAAQGVAAVFDAVADDLERNGAVLGCPVNNLVLELSLTDPDFQRALRRVFDQWEQTIAQRFREDLEKGLVGVKDVDPAKLATLVVAAFSGAMSLAKAAQNATPVRVCRKELARILPASYPRVQPRRPRGR